MRRRSVLTLFIRVILYRSSVAEKQGSAVFRTLCVDLGVGWFFASFFEFKTPVKWSLRLVYCWINQTLFDREFPPFFFFFFTESFGLVCGFMCYYSFFSFFAQHYNYIAFYCTASGARRRGRQRKRWEENVREWTGLDLPESQRAVEDRQRWVGVVASSSVVPLRPLGSIDYSSCTVTDKDYSSCTMIWLYKYKNYNSCTMIEQIHILQQLYHDWTKTKTTTVVPWFYKDKDYSSCTVSDKDKDYSSCMMIVQRQRLQLLYHDCTNTKTTTVVPWLNEDKDYGSSLLYHDCTRTKFLRHHKVIGIPWKLKYNPGRWTNTGMSWFKPAIDKFACSVDTALKSTGVQVDRPPPLPLPLPLPTPHKTAADNNR